MKSRVQLKILELRDHHYVEKGVMSFAASPRVGESVALTDDSGKEQLFEVLAIVHSPQSQDLDGEITLVRIGDRKRVSDVLKGA